MTVVSPNRERQEQAGQPSGASSLSPPPALSQASTAIRLGFWIAGIALAGLQAWIFRYQVSADSISYLDMSDGVMPGFSLHRLINGVWSPLYPAVLGFWRRFFGISAANEIAYGHLLNVLLFVFAFLCFEFLIRSWEIWSAAINVTSLPTDLEDPFVPIPQWTSLILAYSLFLWASLSAISLEKLRPDMLMSGLLYVAVGIVLRMRRESSPWRRHLALGIVLGMAFLAKAAMLPIGLVILACAFVIQQWRLRALQMLVASGAIMLLISSIYFVPLSLAKGKFTTGESGSFNYLVHVDGASPQWYLQDPGSGRGTFLHTPERIFESPPAYGFPMSDNVTHPLRFDPSDWTAGVRTHFDLHRQLQAIRRTLPDFRAILLPISTFPLVILVLAFFSRTKHEIAEALLRNWPLWLVGLAGCAMYAIVHVEPRYVGAFFALFWFGSIAGFRLPRQNRSAIASSVAIAAILPVLVLTARHFPADYRHVGRSRNVEAKAAAELQHLGLRPADRVGLICPGIQDLAVERIARVEIVAEVDRMQIPEFWEAPPAAQEQLLSTMVAHGTSAVVGLPSDAAVVNRSKWTRLGDTKFWVWFPKERSH